MSFGERNWHGIVRGQGYVRVLVGRARSDMLRDLPQNLPQNLPERIFVPPVASFKIDHLSILLKENGRKARFSPMSIALAHYIRLYVTCNAPCSRNIYCRKVFRDSVQISALFVFTSSKCRRSHFIYTKIPARPRSHFIYTKISARPRSDFLYTKNFL